MKLNLNLKKINADQIKEFLFNHGEKVGLGVCGFLAIVFSVMGFLRVLDSRNYAPGKTWKEAFQETYKRISDGVQSAQTVPLSQEKKDAMHVDHYIWDKWDPKFTSALYIHTGDPSFDKRDNPAVLPILSGKGDIQLDYVRGLVLTHEFDPTGVKVLVANGGQGNPTYLHAARAQRMVVGTAVFPMKQQFERFFAALRKKSQKELFDSKDDLPTPLGFDLIRYEIVPDKKDPKKETKKEEFLVRYDSAAENKANVLTKNMQKLLQESIYDDRAAEVLTPYLWSGLVMPMPQMANVTYPGINVAGIQVLLPNAYPFKKVVKAAMPNPAKGAKPGDPKAAPPAPPKLGDVAAKALEASDPPLASRLFSNKLNVYHVLGYLSPDAAAPMPAPMGGAQPQPNAPQTLPYFSGFDVGMDGQPIAKQPPAGKDAPFKWERNAIVRFFDPDVVPGKTYQYAIRIYMKNPNYKKEKEVQFADLARDPELPPSPLGWTERITIPKEYHVYAVDQLLLNIWAGIFQAGPNANKVADLKKLKDYTHFQIHQWLETKADADNNRHVIGDWGIAGRVEVRKGDYIGSNVIVKVPEWNKNLDGFEVVSAVPLGKNKGMAEGIVVNMMPAPPAGSTVLDNKPLLVDFYGGKHMKGGVIDEEAAVDALILLPNGQLLVFNSRDDSDDPARQERVTNARKRLE